MRGLAVVILLSSTLGHAAARGPLEAQARPIAGRLTMERKAIEAQQRAAAQRAKPPQEQRAHRVGEAVMDALRAIQTVNAARGKPGRDCELGCGIHAVNRWTERPTVLALDVRGRPMVDTHSGILPTMDQRQLTELGHGILRADPAFHVGKMRANVRAWLTEMDRAP